MPIGHQLGRLKRHTEAGGAPHGVTRLKREQLGPAFLSTGGVEDAVSGANALELLQKAKSMCAESPLGLFLRRSSSGSTGRSGASLTEPVRIVSAGRGLSLVQGDCPLMATAEESHGNGSPIVLVGVCSSLDMECAKLPRDLRGRQSQCLRGPLLLAPPTERP